MELTLVRGDITAEETDVVVNAANSSLLGGGGVDGAIHRAGGPEILAECEELRRGRYAGGLPTGDAVATTAGRLPARWVVHTVGPVYAKTVDRSDLLRSCYRRSLSVCDELGAVSAAFPLISSGVYGWPKDDAVRQALTVFGDTDRRVAAVRLVLWDDDTYETAVRVRNDMAATGSG